MPSGQAIVLIGMPGAGKSTVGRALAQLLHWGFVDVDDAVADDVPTLIERDGIEAFRAREAEVIMRLDSPGDRVVSVGGGAVLDPANRARLAALGPVVWVRAKLPTLVERVGEGADRPLLSGDVQGALARLLRERTPVYEATATITVDVDDLDPHEAAVEIVKALSNA